MLRIEQKHFVRILLVVLSATILIGVAIMWYFLHLSNDNGTIKLDITANGVKNVEFEGLGLIPGEERVYNVALRSDIPGDYALNLVFVENGEAPNPLKNYVYARMQVGEKVLCDTLLSELFEGDVVKIYSYLAKTEGCDLVITYYMPSEIGNEAENATADFVIAISSVKENK